MYVILPDSSVTTVELTRRFADGGWPASLTARDMRDVRLILPRLHVEQTLDLGSLLGTLGAGVALDCGRADFGISRSPRGGRSAISAPDGRQKVYLDVTTKAEAAP